MTARPWGTTGRVTLDGPCWGYGVKVDRAVVGVVIATDSGTGPWRASIHFDVDITGAKEAHLPTLDAAVMWVIRRADADVWRQERGPVCWVRWHPETKPRPWHLTLPGGSRPAATYGHHSWAMTDGRTVATNLASQATRDLP